MAKPVDWREPHAPNTGNWRCCYRVEPDIPDEYMLSRIELALRDLRAASQLLYNSRIISQGDHARAMTRIAKYENRLALAQAQQREKTA